MLRVCVVLAGVLTSTVGAYAQDASGLTKDKALFKRHLTDVTMTVIQRDYRPVAVKVLNCWVAFADNITMSNAKNCFLLQSAAMKIVGVAHQKMGEPIPHKVFTPEDLTEKAIYALNWLRVPDDKQAGIVRRWAQATVPN